MLIFSNLDIENQVSLNDYDKTFKYNLLDNRTNIKTLAPGETICLSNDSVDRLPTASTCFNTLELPNYTSANKLQSKLVLAMSLHQFAEKVNRTIVSDGQTPTTSQSFFVFSLLWGADFTLLLSVLSFFVLSMAQTHR